MSQSAIGSITRGFHRASLEVLGHYSPGGGTVIFNPLQTGNPDAAGTLIHERMHRHLTRNSYYGAFLQALALFAEHGLYGEQFELALDAARATQEGVATWVELAVLADHDAAAFRGAVARLPAAAYGEPPYREWFEAIAAVVPIEPGAGCQDNKSALVLSLGLSAHAGDVLDHEMRSWDDPAALARFLAHQGPDALMKRNLATIAGSAVLHDCMARLAALPPGATAEENQARQRIVIDLHARYDLGPLHGLDEVKARLARFAAHCDGVAARAGLRVRFGGIVPDTFFDEDEAPEIKYVADWEERYPHAIRGEGLTLRDLRWRFQHAASTGLGLGLAIAMYKPSHVHVGTQFYIAKPDGDVHSAEESMKLLDELPISQGELATRGVFELLDEFRGVPVVFYFIRWSWVVWDAAVAKRGRGILWWKRAARPLRDPGSRYEFVMEIELSEDRLRTLLQFRGLMRGKRFALFSVSRQHQQYAAVFFDPKTPRTYALQSVPGEFGASVLLSILDRWGFEQRPFEEIEHPELVGLFARPFLI